MATSTKYPTANTATTGFNGTAANPTDAYTDNTTYASFTPSKPRNDEDAHSWRGFDFSAIPAGSTINSVTVKVQEYMSASNSSGEWRVALFEDVTSSGALAPGVTTAIGATQYTRATTDTSEYEWDLGTLSTEPTLAQLQATNFGVRIEAAHGNTATSYTYYVDTIEITVDYTPAAAAVTMTQAEYRIYDDGVEASGAATADQNRGVALEADTTYLARFLCSSTTAGDVTPKLQYRVRTTLAGGYGSWTDVNATSSYVRSSASGSIADNAVTTERLAGAGTFVAGRFDEVDGAITSAVTLAANEETEWLFGIQLRSADLTWRNNVELRLVESDGTAFDTYDTISYPYLSIQGSIEEDFESGSDNTTIQALNDGSPNTVFDDVNLGTGFTFQDTYAAHGSLSGYGNDAAASAGNAAFDEILCPELFIRYYVYKTATPTSDTGHIRWRSDGSTTINAIRWRPDGTLNIQEADSTNNSAGSPSTGQWVRVEARWVRENNGNDTGILELKYWDTDPDSTGTPDGTVTVSPAQTDAQLYSQWLRWESGESWYFDDVKVSNIDWIGSGADGDATAAPATVAATVTVPTPTVTVTSSATRIPATVAGVAAVDTPTIATTTDATVTPATVAASAAVPTPTVDITQDATATPDAVSAVASVPQPTVTATSDATRAPPTVAAVATVPTPTVVAVSDATVTPAAVAVVASVPTPTVSTTGDATATPAAVTATVAVDTPTVVAVSDKTVTPATVAATVTVPTPTVDVTQNSTVTPAAVAATVTVPTPTTDVTSSATVTPATVAVVAAVDTPTVTTTGDAYANPDTVTVTVTVPTPTISAGTSATATPAAVAATVAVDTPTTDVTQDATVTPAAVAATGAVDTPTVDVTQDAATTPAAVAVTVTVPTPTIATTTDVTATPAAVAVTVTAPTPTVTVTSSATVTPATIAATVAVGTPTVTTTTDATATPSAVAVTVTAPAPTIETVSVPTTLGSVASNTATTAQTLDTTHVLASGDNRRVFVLVQIDAAATDADVSTVTYDYGGTPLSASVVTDGSQTAIASAEPASQTRVEIWEVDEAQLASRGSGSSYTVRVVLTGTAPSAWIVAVVAIQDTDQGSTVDKVTVATDTTVTTDPSALAITTGEDACLVLDGIGGSASTVGTITTETSGQTEIAEIWSSGSSLAISKNPRPSSGATSMDWVYEQSQARIAQVALSAAPITGVNVAPSPATVAATVTVPTPTVTAQASATATPATVAATVAVPTPTVSAVADATPTPATVAVTVTVPTPVTSAVGHATVTPATVTVTVTIPDISQAGFVRFTYDLAQFFRNGADMFSLGVGIARTGIRGFHRSEGWERASGVFALPAGGKQDAMDAVKAVWSANKAETTAVLKPLITAALNDADYRRPNGTLIK